MRTWDNVPILIALPLAIAAAFMSSGAEARHEVASFFAAVLSPQVVDLGGDPGNLLGSAAETGWPLPSRS